MGVTSKPDHRVSQSTRLIGESVDKAKAKKSSADFKRFKVSTSSKNTKQEKLSQSDRDLKTPDGKSLHARKIRFSDNSGFLKSIKDGFYKMLYKMKFDSLLGGERKEEFLTKIDSLKFKDTISELDQNRLKPMHGNIKEALESSLSFLERKMENVNSENKNAQWLDAVSRIKYASAALRLEPEDDSQKEQLEVMHQRSLALSKLKRGTYNIRSESFDAGNEIKTAIKDGLKMFGDENGNIHESDIQRLLDSDQVYSGIKVKMEEIFHDNKCIQPKEKPELILRTMDPIGKGIGASADDSKIMPLIVAYKAKLATEIGSTDLGAIDVDIDVGMILYVHASRDGVVSMDNLWNKKAQDSISYPDKFCNPRESLELKFDQNIEKFAYTYEDIK